MGEECTIAAPASCCGDLKCNRKEIVIDRKGGGFPSRDEMAGGMGICEKPVDGDDGEEDEAKVQV